MYITECQIAHKNGLLTLTSLNYTLTREQKYTKTSTGKIQLDIPIFNIEYKDINGNQKFVPQSQNESEVKNILPRCLANYFFFDCERIEKMGS